MQDPELPIPELPLPSPAPAPALPPPAALSDAVRHYLSTNLSTPAALSSSSSLSLSLRLRCSDLESSLSSLTHQLSLSIADHDQNSNVADTQIRDLRDGLMGLRNRVRSEGGREGSEKILAEELPKLAKEVARVETVRAYAETALKLDNLIGDAEDAVSSSVVGKLRSPHAVNSEGTRMMAINSLKSIEDLLTTVKKTRPQWARLISAVDHRVDHALAVLRPQAIADHRSLLLSLGWPPPVSGSNTENSNIGRGKEITNPLLTMMGDMKSKYCENFLSLCDLQELQIRRKSRQLEGYNREIGMHQPLWVIEEMVTPIFLACERYFSKWIKEPEYIFTLVDKITRDFVDSMDDILQPLIDKARLAGYSCREEWISAMVTSLSTYLAKEVFSTYGGYLQDESSADAQSQARTSWLHLVDQMISFDTKTQSLITNAGLMISEGEDGNLQRLSTLSVFCDRPDWLEIWAEIELGEMLAKLNPLIQDEKVWKSRDQEVLMTGSEDYKSPAISGIVLNFVSGVINRSRPIPDTSLRMRFIRITGAPILQKYIEHLFHRCEEADALTALADDDALTKVALSINAARYCESILIERCQDVFFLELEAVVDEGVEESCIFEEEINGLKVFQKDWVDKISTVIFRGFDALCRDFLRNKKQWQEKGEGMAVSAAFVGALDYLHGKVSKLKEELNEIDFVALWKSVASGVDELIFNGVIFSNVKFHDSGLERIGAVTDVLFGVFAAWCLRPEGFFPHLSEGLRLLRLEEIRLMEMLKGKERWLRENGFRHLTVGQAEKIAKNRVFTG